MLILSIANVLLRELDLDSKPFFRMQFVPANSKREDLENDDRQTLLLSLEINSYLGYQLQYLHIALTHCKGQCQGFAHFSRIAKIKRIIQFYRD